MVDSAHTRTHTIQLIKIYMFTRVHLLEYSKRSMHGTCDSDYSVPVGVEDEERRQRQFRAKTRGGGTMEGDNYLLSS